MDGVTADAGQINSILAELKQIPPMRAGVKDEMNKLRADALPPLPKKVLDFYEADYPSWAEMEKRVPSGTRQASVAHRGPGSKESIGQRRNAGAA